MREVSMECVINHTLCLCRPDKQRSFIQFKPAQSNTRWVVLFFLTAAGVLLDCGQFVVCRFFSKTKAPLAHTKEQNNNQSTWGSIAFLLLLFSLHLSLVLFFFAPQPEVIQFFLLSIVDDDHDHQVQVYSEALLSWPKLLVAVRRVHYFYPHYATHLRTCNNDNNQQWQTRWSIVRLFCSSSNFLDPGVVVVVTCWAENWTKAEPSGDANWWIAQGISSVADTATSAKQQLCSIRLGLLVDIN